MQNSNNAACPEANADRGKSEEDSDVNSKNKEVKEKKTKDDTVD